MRAVHAHHLARPEPSDGRCECLLDRLAGQRTARTQPEFHYGVVVGPVLSADRTKQCDDVLAGQASARKKPGSQKGPGFFVDRPAASKNKKGIPPPHQHDEALAQVARIETVPAAPATPVLPATTPVPPSPPGPALPPETVVVATTGLLLPDDRKM